MDKNKIIRIGVVVLFIIVLALAIDQCNTRRKIEKDSTALINSLGDSLRTFVNRDGNNVATISVLQTEKAKDFLAIQSKDKEIQDLQKVVKDYKNKLKKPGSSVTNITTTTAVSNTGTTTVVSKDTVRKDSLVYIYPEYTDTLKNDWVNYDVKMNKDSSTLNLKVTNKYSVIIGQSKKKPFVDVINYNPYSTTDTLRTFQVKNTVKPKRFGIGIGAGVTLNNNLQFVPCVSLGISYNFIRF